VRKIGDVLVDLMAQRGYAQVKSAEQCADAWTEIAGELSQHSVPHMVRGGVLQITVRSSAVLQELTFRKQELLSQLSCALPQYRIRDLRFRVGGDES
jgi:predicted nucleic acid-binding Zn ribbon protein